jgi:hypothetical protein
MHLRLTMLSVIAMVSTIVVAPQASAFTVPLPELTGSYEAFPGVAPEFGAPGRRTVDFVLPGDITAIDQMSVVLSGQWHEGEISCDTGFGDRELSPYLPPLAVSFYSDAFPGEVFLATVVVPDGPFEQLIADFSHCCPPQDLGFSDLIGAELHVELFIGWVLVGSCFATVDTYGSLTDVSIEVVGPVPTDSRSWGGIKSLYR